MALSAYTHSAAPERALHGMPCHACRQQPYADSRLGSYPKGAAMCVCVHNTRLWGRIARHAVPYSCPQQSHVDVGGDYGLCL